MCERGFQFVLLVRGSVRDPSGQRVKLTKPAIVGKSQSPLASVTCLLRREFLCDAVANPGRPHPPSLFLDHSEARGAENSDFFLILLCSIYLCYLL